MMKKILLAVAILIVMSTFVEAKEIKLRATGYYISGAMTKAERKIEGGTKDRYGNPLRPLQDYVFGSFVSVAVDPRVIKLGTILKIKEYPGIIFVAVDVGSAIRGKKIDLCVLTKKHAYELPKYLTIEPIVYIPNINKYKNYGFGENLARR